MSSIIYVSGALSDVPSDIRPEYLAFYEAIGALAQKCGFTPYVPHLNTDPVKHKNVTPKEVDYIDRTAVTSACLVVAVVDNPSLGVGIEVEMAYHANKPVVLVCQRGRIDRRLISRLVRGNPAVDGEIIFSDFADALSQLEEYLGHFRENQAKGILPESLRA